MTMHLVRFFHPEYGARVGVWREETIFDVGATISSVAAWLRGSAGRVAAAIADLEEAAQETSQWYPRELLDNAPAEGGFHLLPPVDEQDVWAAGVTYARSREARQEEAIDGGDIYARVYQAERPELFFKARGPWVVGPRGAVGIRRDARWNVPEPELGLVVNPALEIVGRVVGNDMSSRDIEGVNPLYLPQAKIYTAACALGPGILLDPITESWPQLTITMEIERGGTVRFRGETHTSQLRRRPDELVAFLGRCLTFPDGAVLLTGTGIVPPDDFTLQAEDMVRIQIEGVGALENRVITVG